MMFQQNTFRFSRRGVTLIEVIFSIGVVLIGLLGVVSILPLAGKRSQDAVGMNAASAFSVTISQEIQSRRLFNGGRLVGLNAAGNPFVLDPTAVPPDSFCIDPLFFSALTTFPDNAVRGFWARLFPYYQAQHDPTRDPSTAAGWPPWGVDQPRMLRVGIRNLPANALPTLPFNVLQLITAEEGRQFAESADDLVSERPKDRSLSAILKTFRATTGGFPLGKRFPSGEFSWMVTVNPLPGGRYASVASVVIRNRERQFAAPTDAAFPEQNPTSQRLAYVTFATGFRGGAGGTVHLVSNQNTVSRLHSGDWLMLSRQTPLGPIHRWFRVSAVDGDAEKLSGDGIEGGANNPLGAGLPNPNDPRDTWRRKVYLDGPDWHFGFTVGTLPVGYADTTFGDNTYATLVEGVVAVTEEIMRLDQI